MAGSLKDQLLKAGLVTAADVKKVERAQRAAKQARRRGSTGGGAAGEVDPEVAEARARALEQQREKARRDRELVEAIKEKAAAKALRAELKQIIQHHDQRAKTQSDDDVPYNFLHGKRVKRIYVAPEQREGIIDGRLVIVNDDGRYHLLPKAAAEKVRARDAKRIIVANDPSAGDMPAEPGSDAAYYARFKVPDDLDW